MAARGRVGERERLVGNLGEEVAQGLVAGTRLVVDCYGVVGAALVWLPSRWKVRSYQRVRR